MLLSSDLTNANLWESDLTNADFWQVNLSDANLARAELTDVTFAGANLSGAAISYNELDSIEIDEGTKFEGKSLWEAWADEDAVDSIPYLPWSVSYLRAMGRTYTHPEDLEQAELQYRATQRLLRENNLQQLPELAIREKHARRKRVLVEREYLMWFKLAFYRWPLGYGERIQNVIATSVLTIVGFALLYPFFGGMEVTEDQTSSFSFTNILSLPFEIPETAEVLWANLYFSAVTFSTLGYGDIQPASAAVQALASLQSLFGALLMAYLVFVLGRRTTW